MTTIDWLDLLVVLLCLLLSAFFAGSETALTASSRASMARMEKHGNRRAAIVNRLLTQRERLIGALLLGNNAVNIAASALATGVLLAWFGNAGVVYATALMTVLVVVFAEVLPKTAAFNSPDRIALLVARPMEIIVKLVESGPLRAVIQVKNHFQNSTFVRDITLYAGIPRVDVKMQAEWHEKHILLKVAFPVSAHSNQATYEIPFGSVQRPTTRNTPAEQAQFEVPGYRWADISEDKHGFSLLNDCKYGYDAKGNVLRLSLLRSPVYPDPHADEGHHEFTYSMYPHGGDWKQALTVRQGYQLNYKLIALPVEKHQGALASEHSFLQVPEENVIVSAIKKAEDENALVVRFFEWAGKQGDVTLQLPPGAESATETDLMEKRTSSLSLNGSSVKVATKPYEIKTVEVKFSHGQQAAAKP